MIYGSRLNYLRESEAITLSDIAKKIGVDRRTMQHYETEYIVAPIDNLVKICDYLKISLDYLLKLNEIKKYNHSKTGINRELFTNRIKNFRKENKLSQEKLAEALEISQSVISDYEKNKYDISTRNLYTICKKYNISADYLLGKIDYPKYLNSTKK